VAITLRGWAPSDAPPSGYTYDTAAADIRTVLDSLHVRRAVLVGHSMAGSVITRFAAHFADRTRALIYLDGAWQFAGHDSAMARRPFLHPSLPPIADTSLADRIAVTRDYLRRYVVGAWTPALEAVMWTLNYGQDSAWIARRDSLTARYSTEDTVQTNFSTVTVPALSICAMASPATVYPWLTPDSARWRSARAYVDTILRPEQRRECSVFGREAPHGATALLESGHYVFITRKRATLRLVRHFATAAPK
jgi:pimeloyl-ACP methyl ester carboxylesterase